MPLFTSTYTNKVDKKGRVSVPAAFRSTLPDGAQFIAALPSLYGKAIEGFDYGYLKNISEKMDSYDMMITPVKKRDPAAKIISRSIKISIDSDGRIVLPQKFLDHAGITDKAVFVGLGRTFQILSVEEYEALLAEEEGEE